MPRDIARIRERLRDGEGLPEDYTWAKQRLQVLVEWPDDLTWDQANELAWLREVTAEMAA